MLRDGEVVGLFVVWRNEVKPFTESEISVLSTFADQAVLAIDMLRLFRTIEVQRAELARYAPEAATLISSELKGFSRAVPVFRVALLSGQ